MIREIRFYTDEHVAYAVARGLRRRGVDVVTSQEARMLGASDEEQLALAASQGRVIITQKTMISSAYTPGGSITKVLFTLLNKRRLVISFGG